MSTQVSWCGFCGDKLPKQRCSERVCYNRDEVFEDFIEILAQQPIGPSCSLEHEGNEVKEEEDSFKLNYV